MLGRTPPPQPPQTRSGLVTCAHCNQRGVRNDELLQCDACDSWYHFTCAEVGVDALDISWQCSPCIDRAGARLRAENERALQASNGIPNNPRNDEPLVHVSSADPNLVHEPIRNQNLMAESNGDHIRAFEPNPLPQSAQHELQDESLELDELEEELMLIKRERELLTRKRELKASLSQQQNTVNQQPLVNNAYANTRTTQGSRSANVNSQGLPINPPFTHSTLRQPPEENRSMLAQQQLAARQSMPRELPRFSGLASEWPVFYSCYTQTTDLCGLSNNENLIRLQRSLTGAARTLVEAQLSLPACVPSIVETLKMVFGRPEYVVEDQLNMIRKTPPPKSEKLDSIVVYAIAVKNMCTTLEQSGMEDHLKNSILLRELVDKLPPSMKLDWVSHSRSILNATIKHFSDWLHAISVDICTVTRVTVPTESRSEKPKPKNFFGVHSDTTNDNSSDDSQSARQCGVCNGPRHKNLGDCSRFHQMTLKQRWDTLRKLYLCRVCLIKHRPYCDATQHKCGIDGCVEGHHMLLHSKGRTEPITGSQETSNPILAHSVKSQRVLYCIVPITVTGPDRSVNTFALLDGASSVTMVEDWVLDKIGTCGRIEPLHLQWTGNAKRTEESSQIVRLQISGRQGGCRTQNIMARSVKSLDLPPQSLNVEKLKEQCKHLQKLPIQSFSNVQPTVIIGLDNWRIATPLETVEGDIDHPIATRSRLGWSIQGQWVDDTYHEDKLACHVHVCECNDTPDKTLHSLIQQFYESDHLPNQCESKPFSMDDKKDLETLERTVKFVNGRYQARLLWKFQSFELPDSWPMALKRWQCLERELKKNPVLHKQMDEQITKFVHKGYARVMSEKELTEPVERKYTLPIFPVFNPNKPNKVRIVFDAAAKVNGMSLNSFLSKGPDQNASLYSILINFRIHNVGITGDVEEMFQQILVDPEDQHVQRFIWDDKVYVLLVMTFGATCSPSIAQYVKNINADRFTEQHPRAVNAIKKQTYADDTLDGAETPEQALKLAQDIKYIYSQGGFNIRNWHSNSHYVQESLEPGSTAKAVNMDVNSELEKVLGMFWDTDDDVYVFNLKYNKGDPAVLKKQRRATKRELLRIQMSIFDPLGLLAHYIIQLKIIVQCLWRTGSDWDSATNDDQQTKFERWLDHLPEVENLKIPRCYLSNNDTWHETTSQLHIFTDAGEDAYASVAYLRMVTNNQVKCMLLGAKTRVAPIKLQSVPRLELNAARLGAQHGKLITESLTIPLEKVFYWTDAKTVLIWLRGNARSNPPYVAYRIADIQNLTDIAGWRYVPSNKNVADEATKLQEKYVIQYESRWYNGPDFLYLPEGEWPQDPTIKHETVLTHLPAETKWIVEPSKFSEWRKMVRVFAQCIRYNNILKQRIVTRALRLKIDGKQLPDPLDSAELKYAETFIIKKVQWEAYSAEMKVLTNKNELKEKSELSHMNPYLDENGLMRSYTRLDNCDALTEESKRPIILPPSHHVTMLIMRSYHERLNHILHATTLNRIRQRFWIPKLSTTYKKLRANCSTCIINAAKPEHPQMAILPVGRLTIARPFTHVGVDYFGPIKVIVGRRVDKRYGALFTCLSTRAIHIEVAYSLSSDSFIHAFRSFMNRRGFPRVIYSDCGTNFIGAEKLLQAELEQFNIKVVAKEFISAELDWKFNPPSSPHMGGIWERQIQTVKRCLYATIPETRLLSDELLRSYLTEVEFTINSRPLTHVTLDGIKEPLTPNHFLLGDAGGVKPLGPVEDRGEVLVNSWRRSQQLANKFWKIWIHEYLPTIAQRSKWNRKTKPIAEGDIVLIVDDELPRNIWLKGRIVKVNKGIDDQVRSAVIQTKNGLYTKPAVKIAVLNFGTNTRDGGEVKQMLHGGECYASTSPVQHMSKQYLSK